MQREVVLLKGGFFGEPNCYQRKLYRSESQPCKTLSFLESICKEQVCEGLIESCVPINLLL